MTICHDLMQFDSMVSNLQGLNEGAFGLPSVWLAQKISLHCAHLPAMAPGGSDHYNRGLYLYMAIINSMGVGRARKSMGNVTYRTVRGRTIGSQKITPGGTATKAPSTAQSSRRVVFGLISRFMAAHGNDIDQSFNKTRYGSQRNYFMKVNYVALKAALSSLTEEATDAEIESAIATYAEDNTTSIYRVKKSGYPVVYLTGSWADSSNPVTGKLYLNDALKDAGTTAPQLATGMAFKIVGNNLAGEVKLVTTTALGGSTTEQSQTTALTSVQVSSTQITGTIAAAMNGLYLVQVKVGDYTLVSFDNSQPDLPLG